MHRRLLLALLFALVLPFAQAAAAAHEVTHLRTAEKAVPAALHCDLCVAGCALTGSAPAAEAAPVAHAPAPHAAPVTRPAAALPTTRAAHFRSRAPPFLA